jgi:threonine dehydratase
MKIIIEPSSALAPATILGNTLGGSEDSAEWKRIVREVVQAKREGGEGEPEELKVVVVISGGNVVLTQVLRMFEKLENEQ